MAPSSRSVRIAASALAAACLAILASGCFYLRAPEPEWRLSERAEQRADAESEESSPSTSPSSPGEEETEPEPRTILRDPGGTYRIVPAAPAESEPRR